MSDANANISVSIDTSAALAQLKELQRQISLFHTNVTRSTSTAALAQRDLQKSLIDDINATGKFAASLTRIKTSAESFTDSLERNKFSMREYFRYAAASTKTFGRMFGSEFETVSRVAEERVKTLQTQYIKLGRDASGALQSIAVRPLTLDMKDYGTQTALAAQKQALFNQLMKQGSTNLLNFGKNTQWAGRQLMVGFTIPLTLLGSTASKVFMDMEAQAIKFKKVYGDLFTPQAETEAALENIKELGRMFARYGVAITDTMGIAAEAAAAGFQGQDLMRQTREATRLSVLGEIDRQQALKTTMALQNAFGLSSDELAGKINFLNAVENQTVTSLNDITEAIPRVAPVIKQLGGDVEDLAYFLTAMKEGGINAAEGANALKSGLASIINPTGKAAAMFEKLNINVQDIVTRNKGNLRGTIQEFAGALDRLDPLNRAQALEQLFGKFQLARVSALFANIAKDGSQASKVLGIASTSFEDLAATADNELGLIEQSASTKFKAAVENLKISIAPVGEEFLKAVTPIVEFFGDIADKFNNLSDRSKRIITILVGVVGAIGPVFLMTFGLLANLVANGLKLFNNLRNGFLRVTSQSNILAEQTQYLTEAQSQAAAVAHSLDQTHANLIQTFNVEAGSLSRLAEVYDRATRAGALFAARNPASMNPGFTQPKKYAKGVVLVPGPKGAGDIVPAMLSPGESVIPAKQTQKYGALIQGIVADNIPGYATGLFPTGEFVGRIKSSGEKESARSAAQRTAGFYSSPNTVANQLEKIIETVPWNTYEAEVEAARQALQSFFDELNAGITNSEELQKRQTKQEKQLENIIKPQASHIGKSTTPMTFMGETFDLKQWTASNLIADLGGVNNYLQTQGERVVRELTDLDKQNIAGKLGMSMQDLQSELDNLSNGIHITTETSARVLKEIVDKEAAIQIPENVSQRVKQDLQSRKGQAIGAQAILSTRLAPGSDFYDSAAQVRRGFDPTKDIKAMEQMEQKFVKFKQAYLRAFNISEEVAQAGNKTVTQVRQVWEKLSLAQQEALIELRGDTEAFTAALFDAAKEAGIAGYELGSSAITGISKGTQAASPSRAAKREGKNVVDGLNQGMREGVDDVTATGQTLGRAATSGVSSGVRQSSIKAPGVIAAGAPVPAPLVIRTETENRMAQAAAAQATAAAQAAQQQKENTDAIKKSTKSYTAYNGKLAGASMALSSLSGVGIMFGGAIGEASQKIFALSSALFALQTITQMLTKEQFLAYIAKRAEIASSAVAAATRTGASAADAAVAASTAVALRNAKAAGEAAKGVAKSGSLISRTFTVLRGFISKALGPISKALRFISAFIPLPAKIVIGLLSLVGGILFYKKKQDEASGALSDFATVARNTKDQLKTYGEIFNIVPGKLITEQSNATPLRKDKRTQVDVIRENEKFIADNQQTIDALKGLSREDALDALMMKGLELRAKGFAEEQVKAILIALAEESGRTDINLNFKGTKFTDQALVGIKGVVTGLAKDVNKEYTSIISNIEAKRKIALDKIKQALGPNLTKEQQQLVANAIASVNKQYDEQLAYELERGGSQKKLEEFTQILGTQMAVIGTALREGVISVKQYNTSWNSLVSSLDTLNPKLRETATALLLENALKEQDEKLAEYVKGLGNATQQTLMLQAATLGLTAEIQMYANALSAQQAAQQSGTTTGGGARIFETDSWVIQGEAQLKKAIAARIKLYKELAKASKDLFKNLNDGAKEKTVLEKIQEEIDLRKNQTKALQRLAKAGVEAETALNILNDPKAAKAIADANVTQLNKYVKLLKDLNAVTQKYKATQDAFKTEDEIFKTQIEYIQNILDYEKYVYDLRYEKDLERIDREETRYDYALKQIEREEKLVNKFYDDQFKALDDLSRKQEQFNALQQGKFSLVQALSQGDMNAAASAIQNIRDQEAKNQLERRRQELEFRKEQEISAIRKDGLTREEIEKRKDINDARRDEIEYEKETFAASQQRFGFTRRQLDLIAEGLDLAKNANINVSSKTFLQNIMNAVAGDADALAASVKESATAFNTYATEVESLRSKMGLQIVSIVDMFKTAKQNAKELAEINATITGKQPTTETQTGGSTGAGTGTPPSGNPFVPSPPTGRRIYDDLYGISKPPKAKRPTALQDRLRQLGILFNSGGKVMGPGTSTSDSIPALLSDGEYVVRASSVDKYGVGLFEQLNAGKFAKGGSVGSIGALGNFINEGMGSFYNSKPVQAVGQVAKSLTIDPLVGLLQSFGRILDPRKVLEKDNRPFTEQLSQAATDAFNVGSLGAGVKIESVMSSMNLLGKEQIRNVASYVKDPTDFIEGSSLEKQLQKTLNRFNIAPSTGPLYRGTKTNLSYLEVGDVYKRPRRTSTTTDVRKAGQFTGNKSDIGSGTILKILPNENTKGISIPEMAYKFPGYGLGKHFDESEVLLSSGNFKVVDKKLKALKNYVPEDSFTNVLKPKAKILEITLEQIRRSRLEEFIANVKNKRSFNSYKDEFAYLNEDFSGGALSVYNNIKYKLQNMMGRSKDFDKLSKGGMIQKFAKGGAVDLVNPGKGKSSRRDSLVPKASTIGATTAIAAFASKAPAIISAVQNLATAPMSPTASAAKAGAVYMGLEQAEKYLSLKYGADKNASPVEKWAKALGRVAFNTAQGGITGAVAGKGVGGLFGVAEGLIEGVAGLAMDGSQYGVKGGSYATQTGFDPNKELSKITPASIATNMAAGAAFSALGQKMLSPIISKISSKINTKPKKQKRVGNKAGEWYDVDANGAQNPAFWGLNENWEVPSVPPVIAKSVIASVPPIPTNSPVVSVPGIFQEMGLDAAAQADFVARKKFNEYIDNFFKGNPPEWSIDQKNMAKPSKKFADFLKAERLALGLPESLPPQVGAQLPLRAASQPLGKSKAIFAPEVSALSNLQQEFYRIAKESMPDVPEEDLRKFVLHRSRVISEDITGQEFSDSFASLADLKNKFFAQLPRDTDEKLVQSFIKIFDFLKTKRGILDTSELDIKTVSGSKRPSDVVALQNTILKPGGGVTSPYTRILRDALDTIWYEKPGQAGEGERLSSVLKEVLVPTIAKDLGILTPESKLGFRLGDLLSPVVLSRDFTPEGFQTLASVMKSSPEKIQFSFADFIKRFNTDSESTIKGVIENFGEVLGFQRIFGSTDHFGLNNLGNTGNSFITPEGKIGLLDFGFSSPPTLAELEYLIGSYKGAQSLVYDFLRLFGISDKQLDPLLRSADGQDVSDLFTKSFFKGLYNISSNAQSMVKSSLFDQRLAELLQKSAGMTIGGNFRYIKDFIEIIANRKDEFAKQAGLYSKGGFVKYFAGGGYARGTDTIPAMLSQGEYVVKKKAVDALGLDTMNKINQGQMPAGNTNSVYNYSLSVNVSNSNANPNDIARTVINQIRQIEGQRIRGNR